MYRTIIAGCNGRERGRGAVSLGDAISVATGARLVLVGVHHHPPLLFSASASSPRAAGAGCGGLALGSTSERVIRRTACPVLVLPRRADAEHADALLAGSVVTAR